MFELVKIEIGKMALAVAVVGRIPEIDRERVVFSFVEKIAQVDIRSVVIFSITTAAHLAVQQGVETVVKHIVQVFALESGTKILSDSKAKGRFFCEGIVGSKAQHVALVDALPISILVKS